MPNPRKNPRSLVTSRTRGKQQPRLKHYLILEGEETERKYFLAVGQNRESNYELITKTPGSSRLTLFNSAVDILELLTREAKVLGRSFNHRDVGSVWIVCDVDDEGAKLKELINRPKSSDIKWIISNPSFDAWIGMHFPKMVTGYIDRHKVQSDLKKIKVLTGSNAKTVSMDLLAGKYSAAKEAALAHEKRHSGVTAFPENNPSSNVPDLIDVLNPNWE